MTPQPQLLTKVLLQHKPNTDLITQLPTVVHTDKYRQTKEGNLQSILWSVALSLHRE